MEGKGSQGRDPGSDRYCELGRGPPARLAGVPGYLNSVLFSALCLASPRVLCGHLTLHWI